MNQQRGSLTMNRNLRLIFVLWTAVAVQLLCPLTACGQPNQSNATNSAVEDFLIENRLSRLLLTYREIQVANAASDSTEATEQLKLDYAKELFKPVADPAWSEQLLTRAKASLAANSMHQSQRLRLAVAHREIELAKISFLSGDRISNIDQIIDDLNLIRRGVKQQVDDLERLRELKRSSLGDKVRLQEQHQLLRHCEYLLGWSYYLVSASKQHPEKQVLRDAESSFRSYLDLPPYLNLTKFSEDNFGQKNGYQRSAVLGLAVVMQAIGADLQAEHCFAIAEAQAKSLPNPKREMENVVRWKFTGLLDQRDFSAAKAMLVNHSDRSSDPIIIDAILNRTDVGDELTSLAMSELALSFKADQLRRIIERSPGSLKNSADLRAWISGYLAWDEYQTESNLQTLQVAFEKLQTAKEELGEKRGSLIRGHCLFLLASCNFDLKNYRVAVTRFSIGKQTTAKR